MYMINLLFDTVKEDNNCPRGKGVVSICLMKIGAASGLLMMVLVS